MDRKVFVLLILGVVCVENNHSAEVRIPGIGAIINRLTNTTFGILRNGINIFSRSVDTVVSTFARVEDRIRALLEEFRRQIIKGIPELSIPVLDPLHIEKVNFSVNQETTSLTGLVEDVTVRHISKFVTDKAQLNDLGGLKFKLDLNLTFPYLTIDGRYKVNGTVGDTFNIYGDGKFWLHLIDFKLAISAIISFEYPRLKLTKLNLGVKLRKLENNFENLMGEEELGTLFNKAISRIAPEALDILWPDMKKPVEKEIIQYVNQILENATIASLARRIFNIK